MITDINAQSVSFTELKDQLVKNPDELPNQFFTTVKHFKLAQSRQMGERFITFYVLQAGTDLEENIVTGTGWKQNDGSFKHSITYLAKDSAMVLNIARQVNESKIFGDAKKTAATDLVMMYFENNDFQVTITSRKNGHNTVEIFERTGTK